MPKKKDGRPVWFKMWLTDKPLIDLLPAEAVGEAVKAALTYFETGQVESIPTQAQPLFVMLKAHIDEACKDHARDTANGCKGGRPKGKTGESEKPRVTQGYPGSPKGGQEEVDIRSTSSKDIHKATPGVVAGEPPKKNFEIDPKTGAWRRKST